MVTKAKRVSLKPMKNQRKHTLLVIRNRTVNKMIVSQKFIRSMIVKKNIRRIKEILTWNRQNRFQAENKNITTREKMKRTGILAI